MLKKMKIITILFFLSTISLAQEKRLDSKEINTIKTEVLTKINDFRKEENLPIFYIDKTTTQSAQKVSKDLLTKEVVSGDIPVECGTSLRYLTYQEIKLNTKNKSKPYFSDVNYYILTDIVNSLSDWKPENHQYRLGIGISEYPNKPGTVTLVVMAVNRKRS